MLRCNLCSARSSVSSLQFNLCSGLSSHLYLNFRERKMLQEQLCLRYFTYFHEPCNIWYHSTLLSSLISYIFNKYRITQHQQYRRTRITTVSEETRIISTATQMRWAMKDCWWYCTLPMLLFRALLTIENYLNLATNLPFYLKLAFMCKKHIGKTTNHHHSQTHSKVYFRGTADSSDVTDPKYYRHLPCNF